MNFTFNPETRQVNLDLSLNEFDLLIALRFAGGQFISPMKSKSPYASLVQNLDRINHQLACLRILPNKTN